MMTHQFAEIQENSNVIYFGTHFPATQRRPHAAWVPFAWPLALVFQMSANAKWVSFVVPMGLAELEVHKMHHLHLLVEHWTQASAPTNALKNAKLAILLSIQQNWLVVLDKYVN